jgi:hypothetical protein
VTDIVYRRGAPVLEPLPDTNTLYLMGQRLLDLVLGCFASQGVSAPARHVIFMSPIPADCEQIAVLFTGWTPMPPMVGMEIRSPSRWVADVSVIITRCTPAISGRSGKVPPTPEQMNEAALIASTDAEVLLCAVSGLHEVGPNLGVLTGPPMGGMQTVELSLQLPAVGLL